MACGFDSRFRHIKKLNLVVGLFYLQGIERLRTPTEQGGRADRMSAAVSRLAFWSVQDEHEQKAIPASSIEKLLRLPLPAAT